MNNNNNNNNNNLNESTSTTFSTHGRILSHSGTSSEDSMTYWPDHVLNGGSVVRRDNKEESTSASSTTESELDQDIGSEEEDDEDESEVEEEQEEGKKVLNANDNSILPRRVKRSYTITTSRPHSAPQPTRASTSFNPVSTFDDSIQLDIGLTSGNSQARKLSSKVGSNADINRDDINRLEHRTKVDREQGRFDDRKRKGKERESRTPRSFSSTPLFNDPLDPLSSLRNSTSSTNNRQLFSAPPNSLSNSTQSPNYASSSTSATSTNQNQSTPIPPPPTQTLQQLLQTVDLSAALLLVQTLQKTQQQNSKPIPSPKLIVPSSSSRNNPSEFSNSSSSYFQHERDRTSSSAYFSDRTNAMSISSADTHTPLLPPAPVSPPQSPIKSNLLGIDEPSPLRPRSSTFMNNGTGKSIDSISGEKKDNRRRSLSINFGVGNAAKKLRVNSGTREALPKIKERILLDERANIGEQGRDFEDQISKVHLNLSPATMRRAQNCSKYFTLRYNSLYSALSTPNSTLPNPLAVSRWRNEKEEAERRYRRAKVGTSGRSKAFGFNSKEDVEMNLDGKSIVKSDADSSLNGLKGRVGAINTIPSYGERRNKHPKAWELYPDEISEFIETGGKILIPEIEGNESIGRGLTSRSTSISSSNRPLISTTTLPRSSLPSPTSSPRSNNVPLPASPDNRFIGGSSSLSRSATGQSSTPSLHYSSSILSNSVGAGSSFQFPPQSSPLIPHKPPFHTMSTIESTSKLNSPRLTDTIIPTPSSPRHLVKKNHGEHHTPTPSITSISSKPLEGGLRNTLSRRLDKIRGKGNDFDRSNLTIDDIGEGIQSHSTNIGSDPSESELNSKSASNGNSRKSISELNGSGINKTTFRRGRLSRTNTSNGDLGFKSSGGEESIIAVNGTKRVSLSTKSINRWPQKWRGKLISEINQGGEMGSVEEGVEMGLTRRRILRAEESDDEEYKVPREVLDLGDEEFIQLNSVLRQVKVQLSHVDTFLPRVPAQLIRYLEVITQQDTTTFKTLNIPVQYSYPRLTASVISQLANSKNEESYPGASKSILDRTATTTTDPENSSSSSSSTSSSSDDSGDEKEVTIVGKDSNKYHTSSIRFNTPTRKESQVRHVSGGHSRRVTDPISKALPTGRARSQTLALPSSNNNIGMSGGGGGAIRGLVHPSGFRVDRLSLLEKAIIDLEKTKKEIEQDIKSTMEFQEKVRVEINELIQPVDEMTEVINTTYDPRLQTVEKHYFRLNTSKTKTGFSVDILWGLLSYVITGILWTFWFFATAWYLFYSIVKSPFVLIRWLFKWLFFL